MKTRQEVEALKENWLGDPCWDIYDTDGFEEYTDELRAYQQEQEAYWQQRATDKLSAYAKSIGCSDNLKLATELQRLVQRIEKLESKFL